MNQGSRYKLSPKPGSGKQRVMLGGLLLALLALSFIGRGVKAGGMQLARTAHALAPAASITVNSAADSTPPGTSGQALAAEPAISEQTFDAGSYIIPMDNVAQSAEMLRAYGLVYDLLRNGVPVQWIINPMKPVNGVDFTILTGTLHNVLTGANVPVPYTYRGGPFIIAASDAAAAQPVIQAWQAVVGDQTNVHHLTSGSFTANVAQVLVGAPRIAILKDGNETIAFNNLNAASIPDSLGNVWTSMSPDLLTETDVAGPTATDHDDGVLFHSGAGLPRYGYLISEHYNTTSSTPEVVQEVRSWLGRSDLTHAFMQCVSALVFENAEGGLYLTNTGLSDDGVAPTTPVNRVAGHPLSQMDGPFEIDTGALDSMTSNSFRAGVTTLINENGAPFTQRIVLLTGRLDGFSSNGRVTYLAGHDYSLDQPITSNPQTNGVRLFLNSLLASDCASTHAQDGLTLTNSAPAFVNTNQIRYTITYMNPQTSGRPAENLRLTDVLPPGTAYTAGSAEPAPTSVSGGVLTWDLPPVAPGAAGSVTFQVNITGGAGSYTNTAKMNFAQLTVRTVSSAPVTTATCPTITVNPATLPHGVAGMPYSQTFAATGSAGAVSYSLGSGALPDGLSLSPAGILSGAPTAFGAFNFMVRVTDVWGCTGGQLYNLTISPPCNVITVNPVGMPNSLVGSAYNLAFTQTGGTGAITWSVRAGSLPDGLSLDGNTGAVAGTPTLAATFNFTIQAADANNCAGTRDYTLTVGGPGLQFYPLAHPVRLLDTRAGAGGCFTPNAPIAGGTSRTQPARGLCDGLTIPAGAKAITGNITTVQSGGGYLTLYPSSAAQPLVANSNYNSNEILNNVFTVGLGNADGAFKIFVTSDTDVVVDVTGYYAPPGTGGLYFHPLPKPIRLLDTRAGASGCTTPNAPLPGGVETTQAAHLTCDGVTIPTAAKAIVGNATTVSPQGPGFPYLTLFPADAARPLVASSNYLPGQVMNAPFTVGLSAAGEFRMYATTQTELVVDVLGYYSADATDENGAGLLFNPLPAPVRLLDTRVGALGCSTPEAPLQAGSTMSLLARINCNGSPIATTALAVVGNATVVNAAGGYLTFWPSTAAQPLVATSNFTAGQVFNCHFTVGLGAGDGSFKIFTQSQTDLVVDVSGYFAP